MEFENNRKILTEKDERIKLINNYIIEYVRIVDKLKFLVDELDIFGEKDGKLIYIASGYIKFYEDCINKLIEAKKADEFNVDPESECIPTIEFFNNYLKDSLLNEKDIKRVNDDNTRKLLERFRTKLAMYNDGKIKASDRVKERRVDQIDENGYLIPNPDGIKLTNKICPASKRGNENCLKTVQIKRNVSLPKIFPIEEKELLVMGKSEYDRYTFYLALLWSIIPVTITVATSYPQKNILIILFFVIFIYIMVKYIGGDFKNLRDGNCMTFGKVAYWLFIKPLSLFKKEFRTLAKYKRNLILYEDKNKNKYISYFHAYCPYCLSIGDESDLHLINQKNGVIAVCEDAPKVHRFKFDHKRKVLMPL